MTTPTHSRLGYIAVALLFFLLGVLATRWLSSSDEPSPQTGDDGGVKLVIDAGSIELLPDASLRLDLPRGFDASEPTGR